MIYESRCVEWILEQQLPKETNDTGCLAFLEAKEYLAS